MRDARFQRLIAARGARFERWPDAERDAGRDHAESSSEARRATAEARFLDRALDLAHPAVSDAAVERLLARLDARIDAVDRATVAAPGLWTRVRPHVSWATFLTAMWLVGVGVGTVGRVDTASADASLDGLLDSGYHRTGWIAGVNE